MVMSYIEEGSPRLCRRQSVIGRKKSSVLRLPTKHIFVLFYRTLLCGS